MAALGILPMYRRRTLGLIGFVPGLALGFARGVNICHKIVYVVAVSRRPYIVINLDHIFIDIIIKERIIGVIRLVGK